MHNIPISIYLFYINETLKENKCLPVAQLVEHGASNAKIMDSQGKQELIKCKNCNLNAM